MKSLKVLALFVCKSVISVTTKQVITVLCLLVYPWLCLIVNNIVNHKKPTITQAEGTLLQLQTEAKLYNALQEICGKNVYIGYFDTTSNKVGLWVYLVSTHSVISEQGMNFLQKISYHDNHDGSKNIIGAMNLLQNVVPRQHLNPKNYKTPHYIGLFDSDTRERLLYFYNTKYPLKKEYMLTYQDAKDDPIMSYTFLNLALADYSISEVKFRPYIYNLSQNDHINFLTLSIVDDTSPCFLYTKKRKEMFEEALKIIYYQKQYD